MTQRIRGARIMYGLSLAGALWGYALGGDPGAFERAGDREWGVAVPCFRSALEAWERLGSERTVSERSTQERSRRERGALAVLLRDSRLLELLRPLAGTAEKDGLSSSLRPLLAGGTDPGAEAVDRLARVLEMAARQQASRRERGPRDEALLIESMAWAHRLCGEVRLRRADEAYEKALSLLPNPPEARDLYVRGRILHKLRRLDDAMEALEKAGAARPELRRDDDVDRLHRLRSIALAGGDAARAKALLDEIVKRGGTAEEPARPGVRFASFLAGSSADLADAVRTLDILLRRHPLAPRCRALLSFILGDAASGLGEHALAGEAFRGAAQDGDPWLRSNALARLGFECTELGDYEAAALSLEEVKALVLESPGSEPLAARVRLNLSRALLGLGEIERARAEAQAVLQQKGTPPEISVRARILVGGSLYESARERPELLADASAAFEAAERELDAARTRDKSIGGSVELVEELSATLAINRGNVARLRAKGETGAKAEALRKEAMAFAERALRAAEAAKLWPLAAIAGGNLGELHLESGDLASAKQFTDWSLGRARELRLFETEWRCLWYQGRIAAAEGREEPADACYAQAAAVIESYRTRILDAERKSGFLTDKIDFFNDWVEREVSRGRNDRALAAAERAKARALVDSLGWRFVALADPGETALYREYVSLLSRSERARDPRRSLVLGLEGKTESFEELRARLQALKGRLTGSREHGSALRALIDGDPADTASILSALPAGSVLVEYCAVPQGLVALLVRQGSIEAVRLPVKLRELASLVERFLRANAGDAETARRLYRFLFEPLSGRLGADKVIVVPYGVLHQLPFETLRDDKGYLVERLDVSYLPSASALRHLRRGSKALGAPRLLAVVDPDTDYNRDGKPDMPPLPHARAEVSSFASSFAERVVLEGPMALKLSCQKQAAGFDVIHYACHGEFYPARPWESALFLSGGVVDGLQHDGRLRAREVYALDLRRSRLVALSGCETGRSQVSPGDDTVSLGAAFLHSGASSLLVSLWKVEDRATAALMKSFYEKWIRGGKDKSRALRETKLELLTQGFAHPRQWGAFVLVGDS